MAALSSTKARSSAGVEELLRAARASGASALEEHDAKYMLAEFGICVPRGQRIGSATPVQAGPLPFAAPYVLKALASVPLHKSDMGAVKLNLASSEEVEEARRDMAARLRALGIDATGFLVEEMAQPGIELVIGGMIDPQLGPMLMIGAGGVYAEILDDVSFRLCPFVRRDAEEMLGELKIAPILRGARGRPPVAIEPIIDALMALGGADGLFVRHADVVTEFDINPLIARPDGLVAVDARFVLGGSQAHG